MVLHSFLKLKQSFFKSIAISFTLCYHYLQNSVALNIYYSRVMEGGHSTESYMSKGYDRLVTIYNDKDEVIDQV